MVVVTQRILAIYDILSPSINQPLQPRLVSLGHILYLIRSPGLLAHTVRACSDTLFQDETISHLHKDETEDVRKMVISTALASF